MSRGTRAPWQATRLHSTLFPDVPASPLPHTLLLPPYPAPLAPFKACSHMLLRQLANGLAALLFAASSSQHGFSTPYPNTLAVLAARYKISSAPYSPDTQGLLTQTTTVPYSTKQSCSVHR